MSTSPEHPHVRSYSARRGRLSPLTLDRIDRLLPRHTIPAGPLGEGVLGRPAPLVLEVGSGHGAAARAYAAAHPGHDIVAVDVYVPGLVRMLAAAEADGLTNLAVHRGDAVTLLRERVVPQSLSAVHLFFPDPWPKPRQAKRRFVAPPTLDLVARALRPGGRLLVATDQDAYADHALAAFADHGGFVVTVGDRPAWRPREGFERKGIDAGRRIIELSAAVR